MRILYPVRIDSYWPIGTIFREVGKRLPHNVTAFVSGHCDDMDFGDITTISIGETRSERAWSYLKTNLTSSWYDLIHTGPINHNLIAALRQVGAPTAHIHTIHNAESGITRGPCAYMQRSILVSLCDQLTAVSAYAGSVVHRHTRKQREPAIIPNGVDTELFEPERAETVSNRVLYVGRTADRKHPEMIAKIARELPRYDFYARISGLKKDTKLYHNIRNRENVELLDYLSRPQLAKEYSAAEVFITPYEREGFGMAVLEALASGTPVVGYSSGNLPALLHNNGGKLVESLSAAEWGKAIKQINSESAGGSAREYAKEYDWNKIAQKYDELYSHTYSI